MADGAKKDRKKAGVVTGAVALGVGATVAAGVAARRAFARRESRRYDPYREVAYGRLRGTAIGPIASSDGTLLHAEESGSGPVTLVLSHGFSLNCTLWHHQLEELSAEHRIIAFDHRGHGRSALPPSEDWTLDALARDLDAVVRDATGPDETVILVGHSMGGMTVLNYCHLFPEMIGSRVKGIVLADTASADVMGGVAVAGGRRAQAAVQALQAVAMRMIAGSEDRLDAIRKRNTDLSYMGTRLMGFGEAPSQTQVRFVEQMLADVPSHVWLSLLPAILGLDVHDALFAIDVPALVIVGSRDRLTPLHAAQRIAEAIPRAELAVIDGAGHTPMLEKHRIFNDHVRRFAAGVVSELAAR